MQDHSPLANFYLKQEENNKACLLALRDLILSQDHNITNVWKYKMPFFCWKGKMFCYLWINKDTKQPYLGIVEGKNFSDPVLIQEGRSRMKIIMINQYEDLPFDVIEDIIQRAIDLYKKGIVEIKK